MKKALYLLLFTALSAFANAAETVTVSGKIIHPSQQQVTVRGESFLKEIKLKPDGSFSATFPIDYKGTYTFTAGENRMSLYLTKGTKLALTVDEQDFYKTMKYTGTGSVENQYIADKTLITLPIKQNEIYALGETEFLTKLQDIKTSMLTLYDKTKFGDAEFRKKEAQNINYFEQLYFLNYPSYHAHYAKIEGFKPTDKFPQVDPLNNVDDDEAFLFSNSYKQYVNEAFSKTMESKLGANVEYVGMTGIAEIKKYKSQNIKNAFAQNISYEISAGNPESQNLYNELMAISTNPYFKKELTEKFNKISGLTAGKPSPQFDYENNAGGKTSLASLKGSYVYIDVWATWCGPCRQEIPHLQQVEKRFEANNIKFVSISVDVAKDHEKWKKMVADKQLGGIQLFADNNWNSQFVTDYAIDSIPRFILISPDGTIISADAPRPSDPKLAELLTSLKI